MSKKYKNTKHKNPFREDRPKRPFPWLTLSFSVLCVTVVVLLSVLAYNTFGSGVRKFTTDAPGSTVYDRRSGITYHYDAMSGYQAATLEGVFATCGDYTFYEIDGIEPEKMLFASLKDGSKEIPYGIFCIEDYAFPKLEELTISAATLLKTEINTVPISNVPKESAAEAMNIFLTRESSEYPSDIVSDTVLDLYFFSENYSYLCYTMKFFVTETGDRYLSDLITGRHVKLESDELLEYFPTE